MGRLGPYNNTTAPIACSVRAQTFTFSVLFEVPIDQIRVQGDEVNIGDPHSGQKCRVSSLPLSAVFVKPFGLPEISLKLVTSTGALMLKALPVHFRQSEQ